MKLKFLLSTMFFLNLIFSNYSYSQNYDLVDSIVDSYPKDLSNSDKLVELINKDFSKQNEKARAVFRWVTTNISYDIDLSESMNSQSLNAFSYKTEKEREIKEKKFKSDLVANAMSSKKAVCHGYSVLVELLCQKIGLEAKTIIGNLKSNPSQINELPTTINHAWNVVKIGNSWQFIDATLGAGFISSKTNLFKFYFNEGYFFTNPERFFLNHYPSNEEWLLIAKNKYDFAKLPLFFGYYLQYKYQIIKPEFGLHSINKNGNFTFQIQGLDPSDGVEYAFNYDNKRNYLDQEDNSKDFTIALVDKKDDYLSIFVNGKIIAIYKIEVL